MEIIVAKNSGFCFGVKRAVDTVTEELKKGGEIYTYGPIIHNDEVVGDFERQGVRIINDIDELKSIEKIPGKRQTVIIRAHGAPKRSTISLTKRGWSFRMLPVPS